MKSYLFLSNLKLPVLSIGLITALVLGFQNCSRVNFIDGNYLDLASSANVQSFKVGEDSPLEAQPKTFTSISRKPSVFTISRQPTHGKITSLDENSGHFIYKPAEKYFGDDFFQYVENESGATAPHIVDISIQVIRAAHLPTIATDTVGFEMNTLEIQFAVVVTDYHDPSPRAVLALGSDVKQLATAHGIIKQIDTNKFSYTPTKNFRGSDEIELIAVNSLGETSKKKLILNIGNPFHGLEPSMAVRAVGCVACHLKTDSKVISDFGAGNDYFFGKQGPAGSQFSPPYSYYNDHGGAALGSASISEILVPDIKLPFVPASATANILSTAQGQATTLAEYAAAGIGQSVVPLKPSIVTVKSTVLIGAPSIDTLKNQLGVSSAHFVYLKNQSSSPDLNGLDNKGSYFQSSTLTCDGDLTIDGTLFLKDLILTTDNGCRIYTTGGIFINGPIKYVQFTAGATDNTNLQLVSSTWINLGVGVSHCESDPTYQVNPSNPLSWYKSNGAVDPATSQSSPLYHRLIIYPAPTRSGLPAGAAMRSVVQGLSGFLDASCRTATVGSYPRDVHYERLLLNAPRVDSRYTGQFTGVIISEVILMSLSSFTFAFDPVFSRVPVLPLLQPSDFLVVK